MQGVDFFHLKALRGERFAEVLLHARFAHYVQNLRRSGYLYK
jgi:hypothetical protein